MTSTDALIADLEDARARTFELVADLSDDQLLGPRLSIVNPMLWEIGHVAWFQEYWVLRHALGEPPILANADALYDSSAIPHDVRWDLPLPSRAATVEYLHEVLRRVVDRVRRGVAPPVTYFLQLSLAHEDMHDEAFTYTRQTLGYPAPPPTGAPVALERGALPGDVEVPGGRFLIGAPKAAAAFLHDNEKWQHEVELKPFRIARAPVTQGEYARFVEAGGPMPVYWRRADDGGFERRHFDRWVPLEPHAAVIHVSWYEAERYCRWVDRRLPSEAEWEVAAEGASLGNLDCKTGWTVDVAAFPESDSTHGCRQMLGNVWEWTDSWFQPYPGFSPDPYRDYSLPWF